MVEESEHNIIFWILVVVLGLVTLAAAYLLLRGVPRSATSDAAAGGLTGTAAPATETEARDPSATAHSEAVSAESPTSTAAERPQPTDTPAAYSQYVNAGQCDTVDWAGVTWEADRPYSPGSWGHVGSDYNAVADDVASPVAAEGGASYGEEGQYLHRCQVYGQDFGYTFDLPNGDYLVRLRFADPVHNAGARWFDVIIEGRVVLDDFDIAASAGGMGIAVERVFVVTVTDEQLHIAFKGEPTAPHDVNATLQALGVMSGGTDLDLTAVSSTVSAATTPKGGSAPLDLPTATLPTAPPEPGGIPTSPSTPVVARGAVYYVSPTGDDGNPGTEARPWRTVQKAADVAAPGDTVYVRGGSYKEVVMFHRSGTERRPVSEVDLTDGNTATFTGQLSGVQVGDYLYVYRSWHSNNGAYPIVEVGANHVRVAGSPFATETGHVTASIGTPVLFQAYPGETVTLDPQYEDDRGSPAWFASASYVILDGFRVTGSLHAGVGFNEASHNVFRNGEVFKNGRPGFYLVDGSTYNLIVNNEIHDNGLYGPGEGVYIGKSPQDGGNDTSHHNHIVNNHFYDISEDEGADIKDGIQNTVIEGNLLERCDSTWGVIIIGTRGSESLIYANTLRENSGSPDWAGAIMLNGPGNVVFNNLIYATEGLDGIYVFRYPDNKVFHNTIHGLDVGIGFDSDGPGLAGTEAVNNILSQNGQQIAGYTGGVTVSRNLFDGSSEMYGVDPIQADPQFVDAPHGDFRLQSTSPAIDAGPDVGIYFDILGNWRPQGSGYDLGAFEFLH
jgi:parallel beta-helix repeat protein